MTSYSDFMNWREEISVDMDTINKNHSKYIKNP